MNDERVRLRSVKDVQNDDAYILFYIKRQKPGPPVMPAPAPLCEKKAKE